MSGKGKTTLNELMGKHGEALHKEGMDLEDLPKILGDGMPKLEFHAIGRVRLMRALQQRFGHGYRNVPGVSGLMKKFDDAAKTEMEHHLIKKRLGRGK
jgi:hypothetical protein